MYSANVTINGATLFYPMINYETMRFYIARFDAEIVVIGL